MKIQSKKLISFLTSTSMTISALSLPGFSAYAETNSTSTQTSETQYSENMESSKAYRDTKAALGNYDLTSDAKNADIDSGQTVSEGINKKSEVKEKYIDDNVDTITGVCGYAEDENGEIYYYENDNGEKEKIPTNLIHIINHRKENFDEIDKNERNEEEK